MTIKRLCVVVLAVGAAFASGAWGLVINGSGTVTDWAVTPTLNVTTNVFSQTSGGKVSTLGNNYSPITYPSGVGNVPSPGGAGGETWDLEEMHVRLVGSQLQVLVINKSGRSEPFSGGPDFGLGDLFITTQTGTYGMVTRSGNQGLAEGDIYQILSAADTQVLQNRSTSYIGNALIEAAAGPWAVKSTISSGQKTGAGTINEASHNYGGSIGTHSFIEYLLDVSQIGGAPTLLQTHLIWGCGNDLIETEVTSVSTIPEPASLALIGAGTLLMFKRRPRKA